VFDYQEAIDGNPDNSTIAINRHGVSDLAKTHARNMRKIGGDSPDDLDSRLFNARDNLLLSSREISMIESSPFHVPDYLDV